MSLTTLSDTSLAALSDHDLLLGGLTDALAENRASAQRWERLLIYFRRRLATETGRRTEAGHFALTARQETAAEVGELWGMPEGFLRGQLATVLWLSEHFPHAWNLCRTGQLDRYRAQLIATTARHGLDHIDEYATLATRLTQFLDGHLKTVPGVELPLVSCTTKQLRNKLAYEIKKIRTADAEARFRNAHTGRDITVSDGEDGISWLTLAGTTDQVQLAAHRLTLAAKQARAAGDARTLDQLRTDLALDLLIRGTTTDTSLPGYARPVINLTVPIQTVMGLADDPGVLSGGTVIPAGLARVIAARPGATWHRMLTDPAGQVVERSTTSYQPTRSLWEDVVSMQTTCFRPTCDRPSTTSELDHRIPWPQGPTTQSNLWPGCKNDHKTKHAPGFSITQTETGSFALNTPAGFSHPVLKTVHPTNNDWPEVPEVQRSATEILHALQDLEHYDTLSHPHREDLAWEHGLQHVFRSA